MRREARHYTIVFIPDDQRRTFTLKVPAGIVGTLVALLAVFVVGAGVLMFRAGTIALQLQLVQYLKTENKRLREDNQRLGEIRSKVEGLERMNAYFERLFAVGGTAETQRPTRRSGQEASGLTGLYQDTNVLLAGPATVAQAGETRSARQQYAERVLLSVPFIHPVQGWVTRPYTAEASTPSELHQGVDFAAAEGTPVRATAPGIVDEVAYDQYLGKVLVIRHNTGFATRYGHCSQILVAKGEHVERGQTVAMVGSTGRSTAPHLHYEVLKNGKQINPLQYVVD